MIDIDIQKSLGRFDLSLKFSIESNRCVIFGSSGSGKSSLLKMIAGFYPPDSGTMKIKDSLFFSQKNKVNLPIQSRKIGYLPQEYTLFPNMTIKENIEYGIKKRRIKNPMDIYTLLEKFKIADCLEKYPNQVSGGQKQRTALLRTIAVKPDILLLDEPFSALDKPTREELRELVADVSESFDIPVIFVTHDLEEAFVFGREIVVIKNGRVVEFGDNAKVFLQPAFVETARLFDFGNIWEIKECRGSHVFLRNGLKLEGSQNLNNAEFLCIKPENIMILRDDTDNSKKENKIHVTIEKINFRGRYINLFTKTDKDVSISINIPPHILEKMVVKKGKTVVVSIKKESMVFCKKFVL